MANANIPQTLNARLTLAAKRAIRKGLNKPSRVEKKTQLLYKGGDGFVFITTDYYKYIRPRFGQVNVPVPRRIKLSTRIDPALTVAIGRAANEILTYQLKNR